MNDKFRILVIVVTFIISFLVSTQLRIISRRVDRITPDRPYKDAKVYMNAAVVFNFFNTYPLQTIFGPDSLPAKPAIFIRNKLYEKGASLIPDNDAEREIWWDEIYGLDYLKILGDIYDRSRYGFPTIRYSAEYMSKKFDELYPHIIDLATLPLKDEVWNKEFKRLVTVIAYADLYVLSKDMSYTRMYSKRYFSSIDKNFLIRDKNEMQKFRNLYDTYLELENKYPKDEYNRMNTESPDNDECFKKITLTYIIGADIYNNKLSCQSHYVKHFHQNDVGCTDRFDLDLRKDVIKNLNSECGMTIQE